MMTPGSRHTAAKSTQRLLLARRVNFLVKQVLQHDSVIYSHYKCNVNSSLFLKENSAC